jgi:DNA (cytosine-5)-methyltransferase 1
MGFDAKWGVLGAADVGANHQRDRIWIVAKWRGQLSYAQHDRIRRWEQQQEGIDKTADVSYTCKVGKQWECSIQTDGCSGSINGKEDAKNAEESSKVGGIQNMANTSLSGLSSCNNSSLPQKSTLEKQFGGSGYEFGTTKHWWETEPNVGRVVDGMANRVDRLKVIGNGQVPLCAATAWRILSD